MAAGRPTIRIGIADHDLNTPIIDGTVKVEGFDLDIASGTDDGAIHQLLRDGKIDACEYSFGTLMGERARGVPYISIPAFPNRKFRLSYIFVNSAAGIENPKDLEGKRVGILAWQNTAGIWARGALMHHYGVDITKIKWFSAAQSPSTLPAGVTIESMPPRKLDEYLVSGQLDAVIQADVLPSIRKKDPRVRRLFQDYKTEEQTYYKSTGIFPISHMITLPQEFVDRHPDAPVALLKAFRQARDEAFQRIEEQQILSISWASALLDEQRALMGETYWAYNVENNRRPLEAMTQFAHEQGLTPERFPVEKLFVPEAAALPGV
jgi:4,5-dihydroxyphthalate decarboxylase